MDNFFIKAEIKLANSKLGIFLKDLKVLARDLPSLTKFSIKIKLFWLKAILTFSSTQ